MPQYPAKVGTLEFSQDNVKKKNSGMVWKDFTKDMPFKIALINNRSTLTAFKNVVVNTLAWDLEETYVFK